MEALDKSCPAIPGSDEDMTEEQQLRAMLTAHLPDDYGHEGEIHELTDVCLVDQMESIIASTAEFIGECAKVSWLSSALDSDRQDGAQDG